MSEIAHPKWQPQIDAFAALDDDDQAELLAALVLERAYEGNTSAGHVFGETVALLDASWTARLSRLPRPVVDFAIDRLSEAEQCFHAEEKPA